MYAKILVPMALDHDLSPEMLEIARALLASDGEIVALHVYEAPQGSVSAYLDEETVRAGFERAQKNLQDKLAHRPDIRPLIVKGHSARSIIDVAKDENVDCIVIGSHKPGMSDFFLGSTAARVVRHAGCAVHVHRTS